MRSRLVFPCSLLCCLACGEGGHGGVPGEQLGTYAVVGKLSSTSCGPGALGAVDPWHFEVRLSRADRELFWLNGREAIAGRVGADGVSFTFETRVEVEALPARPGHPACIVSRRDRASGSLAGSGTEVPAFSAWLAFDYSPEADSDCSPLIGVMGGFERLPCSMAYDLEAERTEGPAPR